MLPSLRLTDGTASQPIVKRKKKGKALRASTRYICAAMGNNKDATPREDK